ncbi:Uncharacterized protein Adt_38951 [Abeliophyllum distichum]|uniref:Uncharacterized protein n=1 Tax=Abeliophyllum distichum TaxID=126358 RepID=A0ABD1Q3V9_9LAMI
MRPQKTITSGEIDELSFDLGIDSQPNPNCLLLDDGLVLTEEDIKMIDAVVVSKLDATDNKLVASVDAVDQHSDVISKKCRKIGLNDTCTVVNTLDDDMLFSEEDLMNMDQSAEHHHLAVVELDAQAITPIPFEIDDVETPQPRKRATRPAACLQSPFIKIFQSQSECSQKVENILFDYKFCMEFPSKFDIELFDRWYHTGLHPDNKVKKFHKDDIPIVPAIDLRPVNINSKMWWYNLMHVATPLTN